MIKLCRDCEYAKETFWSVKCGTPKLVDMVTGAAVVDCKEAREDRDLCGRGAMYFSPMVKAKAHMPQSQKKLFGQRLENGRIVSGVES